MIRKSMFVLGAGLALLAQPVMAQPVMAEDDMEVDPFAALAGMFTVEPLTEEQQTRLPLAQGVVNRMIPDGTMRDMMGPMFDSILGPILTLETASPMATIAKNLGVEESDLALEDEQAEEVAALLDPVWRERKQAEAAVMPELMKEIMGAVEPTMRRAMSELYAINFNQTELTEINAFFETEAGASFARKSFTMASDPRVMAVSMEMLPELMESFEDMAVKMELATINMPSARAYLDLTPGEQARIAELTGYDVADLRDLSGPAAEAVTE